MAIENPRIDTSNVTVAAFNAIRDEEKATETQIRILGKDDAYTKNSPKFKAKVRAYTRTDKKSHTYFHSLSIDMNVDDFMGTAELKCPYDSDLMAYWEPIRQDVVIYGSNRGKEKILFVGRVRGVKQDGYELVIEFQNYAWKFKQLVTQSYANDNVLGKDGYTIMKLMFEALKIEPYVISDGAKKRLKEVGINKDGNLTVNGKELKKIPDLLTRLQKSDPSELITKETVIKQKDEESKLGNIKDINYTLKYEKPTPVMKKIASNGSYSAGSNIYDNAYSAGSSAAETSGSSNKTKTYKDYRNPKCKSPPNFYKSSKPCPNIQSTTVADSLQKIWLYNRNCISDLSGVLTPILKQKRMKHPNYSATRACLGTLSRYTERSSKSNGAKYVLDKLGGNSTSSNSVNSFTKWFLGR